MRMKATSVDLRRVDVGMPQRRMTATQHRASHGLSGGKRAATHNSDGPRTYGPGPGLPDLSNVIGIPSPGSGSSRGGSAKALNVHLCTSSGLCARRIGGLKLLAALAAHTTASIAKARSVLKHRSNQSSGLYPSIPKKNINKTTAPLNKAPHPFPHSPPREGRGRFINRKGEGGWRLSGKLDFNVV